MTDSKMLFECAPSRTCPDEWVVEAIDHASEGEVYAALFSGPGAEARAKEYAALKNGAAAQQPRDLAGRIRALVQEYAGRWADTDRSDVSARDIFMEIMRALRQALCDARSGADPSRRAQTLREEAFGDARMLEAIVRGEGAVLELAEQDR